MPYEDAKEFFDDEDLPPKLVGNRDEFREREYVNESKDLVLGLNLASRLIQLHPWKYQSHVPRSIDGGAFEVLTADPEYARTAPKSVEQNVEVLKMLGFVPKLDIDTDMDNGWAAYIPDEDVNDTILITYNLIKFLTSDATSYRCKAAGSVKGSGVGIPLWRNELCAVE
ncbi:uncharacterized protein DFL_000864 [Arthrobotrys flagrans]|uniref:Uncharacterized protein n=1 Tax=Arthrobotrys flagrans TaxID=97331 RepID=A0A437AFE3_ARTFL|nr:hypothetical protein DFL_000864 [Arthrobotrys flagrans]